MRSITAFLNRRSLGFKKILEYRSYFGKFPNLIRPKTFTERIFLKMAFDRNPKLTLLTDKYLVREYVEQRCGPEILTKLYAVTNNPNEIGSLGLPDKFVMKPNHLSDGVIKIVKEFRNESIDELEKLAQSWLKRNYFDLCNEWSYKNIKPFILFEELLEVNNDVPDDYKFLCFHGKPQFIEIHRQRFTKHTCNVYDSNLSLLPLKGSDNNFEDKIIWPTNIDRMLHIAEKLSYGMDFLRVDLYNVNGRIVFGELTVYPRAGLIKFKPESWDEKFGSYWH